MGWHTARTLLPPPPPRSSGAPVLWLMARGRQRSKVSRRRRAGHAPPVRRPRAAGAPATRRRRAGHAPPARRGRRVRAPRAFKRSSNGRRKPSRRTYAEVGDAPTAPSLLEAFPRLDEALFPGGFWRFHYTIGCVPFCEGRKPSRRSRTTTRRTRRHREPRRPGAARGTEGAHHTGPVALEFNK